MLLFVFESWLYVYVDFIFGTIVGYAQPQNFNPFFRNYFVNGSIIEKTYSIWNVYLSSSKTFISKFFW